MTWLDWGIVLLLNGLIIGGGFWFSRGPIDRAQWFVGRRSLVWWTVGLSMFATNVDNSDFVSVSGLAYHEGMHVLTVYTLGTAVAGLLAAFYVVPAMYRAGLYTNAEYLELRFGPAARFVSVLVQIQYRTLLMGLMIWSMYLLLGELTDLNSLQSWALIVGCAIFAWGYTCIGGLKAVVATDAMQSLVILAAAAVVFAAVWNASGGWQASTAHSAAKGLSSVSSYRGADGVTSPWIIGAAWTIVSAGYWIVNHGQTMRMLGCRSIWDIKMATALGVGVSMLVMTPVMMMGVMARALHPTLERSDSVYPTLVDRFVTGWGLKGLVVAGVVAAAISTFDSLMTSLSALFTHDVYARWRKNEVRDEEYVRVGRWTSLVVLALAFSAVPFVASKSAMLQAFRSGVSVFVPPLTVLYLVGVFTRVPRVGGLWGLGLGGGYGVIAFWSRELATEGFLPNWFAGQWHAFLWSVLFTAAGAVGATLWAKPLDKNGAHEPARVKESRETAPRLLFLLLILTALVLVFVVFC